MSHAASNKLEFRLCIPLELQQNNKMHINAFILLNALYCQFYIWGYSLYGCAHKCKICLWSGHENNVPYWWGIMGSILKHVCWVGTHTTGYPDHIDVCRSLHIFSSNDLCIFWMQILCQWGLKIYLKKECWYSHQDNFIICSEIYLACLTTVWLFV